MTIPIYLEVGNKRTFACAVDWPGLCRAGRDAAAAQAALAEALPRYAAVSQAARVRGPQGDFEIVERLAGSASTDFGVPGSIPRIDGDTLTPAQLERLTALVGAAWQMLDAVVAGAPAELTKGPRGGGRDRDKIVDHVLGAETAYVAKLGVRGAKAPALGDARAIAAHRQVILEALHAPSGTWPPRYAARRIAWHALDHAWEIEDRTP